MSRRPPEAGPPGARRISTPQLQPARHVITDTAEHLAVGVIHGLAGLGKTFAMRACTAALPGRARPPDRIEVCTIAFPARPTMRLLADLLLQALTGTPPSRQANRFHLTAALVRELARVPRLVVVDEAQRLPEECIELLRYLHDHDDTAFGLLYVGGNGCWEVLSRQPMLRSRVWRRQTFTPMSRAEVPQVLRSYHRLYADVDDELLQPLAGPARHTRPWQRRRVGRPGGTVRPRPQRPARRRAVPGRQRRRGTAAAACGPVRLPAARVAAAPRAAPGPPPRRHPRLPLDQAAADTINRTTSTAAAAAATLDLIYPFERRHYAFIRAMTSWTVDVLTANPGHLRTPHADIPIPVHGLPALRAHLGWLRATVGAEPDTPLFTGKPGPAELAEQVLRPLALLSDPRVGYRRSRAYLRGHATTWMHQRGLELAALTDLGGWCLTDGLCGSGPAATTQESDHGVGGRAGVCPFEPRLELADAGFAVGRGAGLPLPWVLRVAVRWR